VETIKKFFLIERQLTPEDEELDTTMKLKRSFVNKRYAAEIDAMYGERAVAYATGLGYEKRKMAKEPNKAPSFAPCWANKEETRMSKSLGRWALR